MTQHYHFPQPKYEVGQLIETRWVTDDTQRLVIDRGVIQGFVYATEGYGQQLTPGFTYNVLFHSPRNFAAPVDEAEIHLINEESMLSLEIPENVPKPKFKLFEEAYYGKHKGTIVGMAYENPLEALRQSSQPGWRYDLSYSLKTTPLEAVSVSEDDTLIYEDSLSRCAC